MASNSHNLLLRALFCALVLALSACQSGANPASTPPGFSQRHGSSESTLSIPGNATFGSGNNELAVDLGSALARRKTAGGMGAFTTLGSSLPAALSNPSITPYNHSFFLTGGATGTGSSLVSQSTVYVATVLQNGTLSSWSATTSMNLPRSSHQSVAYNGYLYVVGGVTYGPTALVTDIQYAAIDASGASVGAWSSTGQALPTNAIYPFAANNVFFLTGYDTSGNPYLYSAPIHLDGTLGAFAAGTAFPTKTLTPATAITSQALYVVGGQQPGSNDPIAPVQIGLFGPNGQISRWATGPALPVGRTSGAAVVDGGFLYVLGGYICHPASGNCNAGAAGNSLAAPILANGMLGPWSSVPVTHSCGYQAAVVGGGVFIYGPGGTFCRAAPQLTTSPIGVTNAWASAPGIQSARGDTALAATLNTLALVGGKTATNAVNEVYTVSLDAFGNFGSWAASPNGLPGPRSGHAALVSGSHLYVIAGLDNTGNPLNDVQIALFKGGGANGAFSTSSSALPGGRSFPAAVATGTTLYVTGGLTGSGPVNQTQMAPINSSSGALGAFAAATNTFTTARSGHASVLYNGRLYVIGGDSGSGKLGDIQFATLDGSGVPGTWTTATNALAIPRSGHAAFASNGVLYVVGGVGDSGELADTVIAPIGADGSPGAWASAGPDLASARHGFGSVLVGNQIILAGGWNGSTPLGDAPTTIANFPAAQGVYTHLFDFQGNVGGNVTLFLDGSATNGNVLATYNGAFAQYLVPIGSTLDIPAPGRYLWLSLTLDDSQSAILAGGGERDVTSLTLTYTAAPTASKLVFSGSQQTVATNACSAGLIVESQDASGISLPVTSSATVALTGSNGVTFYSNSSCTTAITSVQLTSASADSSTFYFKGPTAATVTLTGSTSGLSPASQQEIIQAPASGGATKLVITGVSPSYNLGDNITFNVALQNEAGTVQTAATNLISISLSQNPSGATLSGTASKNAASGMASFTVALDQPGTAYQLQAVGNPPLTDGTAFSGVFDVNAGAIGFNNSPLTAAAGSCGGPALVVLRSTANATIISAPSAIQVSLTAPNGLTFYSDSGCSAALGTTFFISSGSLSTPIYFIAANSGIITFSIAASGYQAASEGTTVTTGSGGGPDGGGGGADGGGTDGGGDTPVEYPDHRTINGAACSTGGEGGPDAALTALLVGGLLWMSRRRSRRLGGLALVVALAALPSLAAEPSPKIAPAPAAKEAGAPDSQLVAVLNFKNKLTAPEDLASMDVDYLVNHVRSDALSTDGIRVMTAENMLALVQMNGKTLAECEGECEVETGRLVGADLVISGELLKFGSNYKLTLRLHDTRSGDLLAGASANGKNADDLDSKLTATVNTLFAPLAAKREKLKEEAAAAEQAKVNAAAKAEADARREEQRRKDAAAQEERALAAKKQEAEIADMQARTQAAMYGPNIGIFGGMVSDPKAKTLGWEAGLATYIGAGWSGSISAVIAPHIGGRLAFYTMLGGSDDFRISFGLRGLVEPLPDGLVIGGGVGFRATYTFVRWVQAYTWVAGEVYHATGEVIFAPLLHLGIQINL